MMSSEGFVSREICGEMVRVERIDEANDLLHRPFGRWERIEGRWKRLTNATSRRRD